MAKNYSIILRPCDNIKVGHSSSGATGYLALSEEIADNDTTYIYQSYSASKSSSPATLTTTVKMDETCPLNAKYNSAKLTAVINIGNNSNAKGSFQLAVMLDGETIETLTSSDTSASAYKTYEYPLSNLCNAINSYIDSNNSIPEITVSYISTATSTSTSSKSSTVTLLKCTQIYLTLDYTEVELVSSNIYVKHNDEWFPVTQSFKKLYGEWMEITEDDVKEILQPLFEV